MKSGKWTVLCLILGTLFFSARIYALEFIPDKNQGKNSGGSILKKIGQMSVESNNDPENFNPESINSSVTSDQYAIIETDRELKVFDNKTFQFLHKVKKPIITGSARFFGMRIIGEKVIISHQYRIMTYDILNGKFSDISDYQGARNIISHGDNLFIIDRKNSLITVYSLTEKKVVKTIKTKDMFDFSVHDKYLIYTVNGATTRDLNYLMAIDLDTLETGTLADLSSVTTSGLIKLVVNVGEGVNEFLFVGYMNGKEAFLRYDLSTRKISLVPIYGLTFADAVGVCGPYVYVYSRHILSFYDRQSLEVKARLSSGELGMSWKTKENIDEVNRSIVQMDLSKLSKISCSQGNHLELTHGGAGGRIEVFSLNK